MVTKHIKHINRYREIATTLVKHGFGYIVKEVGLFHLLSLPKRVTTDLKDGGNGSLGERIKVSLEELGPTFVKLGQLLSMRKDLFPEEIGKELEKLQDHVLPVSSDEIKQVIEQELGTGATEIFAEFDEDSLAAGSIGQVHKAVLHSGEEVIVKVQRPHIRKKVQIDLEILNDFALLLENHYDWAKTNRVSEIVKELADALRKELDFKQEGKNTDLMRLLFEEEEWLKIPKICWDFTTKKVLTMEQVSGNKVSEIENIENFDRSLVAERLVGLFFKQVLEEGFFHGDPHSGNIFFSEGNNIALIDFGQVGRLSKQMRHDYSTLMYGLVKQDTDAVVKSIYQLARVPKSVDEKQLYDDIDLLRRHYNQIPLSKIDLGNIIDDLFSTVQQHNIIIPTEYTLLSKAVITIEGVVSRLDPELNLIKLAEPYEGEFIKQRYNPRRMAVKLWKEAEDFGTTIKVLPEQMSELLQKVKKNGLPLEINLDEFEGLLFKLDRISNRISFSITLLAFSIVIVGLIIGSTFGDSFLSNIPAVEIGFAVAFLMFLWLIYSILRSGKF
ncbi:ABC1 kinase family protein [Pseudalkalibacillus caeni]|uniref:AarF/ABC1/UbiB kinase family protein n=1 Tax=Exobacillus caeni TaxID=2574798 RepID=A0A5R9F8G7_9BACL|nr:AarF/ABC1/UbiB kinase family protein [Pseudalkalibacillus caeni]TLS37918.1 AarF/ABC1/UbiB kinase family protein [Pseudalkalibacillus caeni]